MLLIGDGAGYHRSKQFQTTEHVTLIELPAYGFELNRIENLWLYLKSHYLSNRAYSDYEDMEQAAIDGWRRAVINIELMKTVCAVPYSNRASLK